LRIGKAIFMAALVLNIVLMLTVNVQPAKTDAGVSTNETMVHELIAYEIFGNGMVYQMGPLAYGAFIYQGLSWEMVAIVGNIGSYTETFNVTCVLKTSVYEFMNVTLNPGENATLTFNHTFNEQPGETITPILLVHPVQNESNTSNNQVSGEDIHISNPNPKLWIEFETITRYDSTIDWTLTIKDTVTHPMWANIIWGPDPWHFPEPYTGNGTYQEDFSYRHVKPYGYIEMSLSVEDYANSNLPPGMDPIIVEVHRTKSLYYTLTISASSGGTTDPSPGTYSCDLGTVVSVEATPYSNYEFDYWVLDSANAESQNPISITMDTDHTLHAVFKSKYSPGVGGIVIPVDKFALLAPYIGLASTVTVAAVTTVIYVKRVKRRKEKQ
jgi:hypothetical protein